MTRRGRRPARPCAWSARSSLPLALLTFATLLASIRPVGAQAWVPPAGVGTVNITFQKIDNTGHRVTDGSLQVNGKSTDVAIYAEAEYAVTDRFSVSIGLPYVFAKYVDANPPPPFIPFLPVDECRCWHGGWQDFGVTARYNVVGGIFALTPSVSLGVPSHDYAYRGEAVLGRNLKELRIAVDVGQRLDAISPKLSVEGRYSYALAERVLDIPNNRSNATMAGAFQMTRKLSVRGLASWQRTHGGLRFGSPPPSDLEGPGEVNTPERLEQHDRLLRDNHWRLGGSVSYQLPQIDVFASYIDYVRGTDTHAGHVFTAGVSWPFELRRAHKMP